MYYLCDFSLQAVCFGVFFPPYSHVNIDFPILVTCIAGLTNLGHCPLQPNIPIYLIVLGASSLLSLSLTYTRSIWQDGCISILSLTCTTLLHLFTLSWFIAGGRKCQRCCVYSKRNLSGLFLHGIGQWCKVIKYIYPSTVYIYKFEVLILNFSCYFILLTHCTA